MIKLDDNLLTELGLQALPAEEKKALLRQIYETLEMRVGTTLARQMTDAQLDEFESFINNNDEAGALRWLETNFPNYKDVVAQEFEMLKGEILQAAPQIAASSAAVQQQPMPQPQQTPVYQDPQYAQPVMPPAPQQQYAAPQPAEYQQMPPQPGYQQPMPQQPSQPYQQPQPQQTYQQQPPAQQPYYQQPPQAPTDPSQYGTAA